MRSKIAERILAETPVEVKEAAKVYASELIQIDKRLNKYDDVVLFPKKVEKAKEMLRTVGLPKELIHKK